MTAALARLGRLLAVVLCLALVLGPARPAWAHAELATSDPADGAVLERGPDKVVLEFTEGVTVQPDGVRVLDAEGKRVDRGTAEATDRTVRVPLRSVLPDGGYLVAWRVVSADGHPVHGGFSFSVGTRTTLDAGVAGQAFASSADRRDEVVGAVLRGLAYLAVLGAAGATLVGAALRHDRDLSPVGRVVAGLSGLGLVALLLQVPVLASLSTGRGVGSVLESGVLRQVLGDGVGVALGLSAAGLLALLVTTGLPFRGPARTVALAGAALAPLGFAVTGHTRTMEPAAAAYLADVVHLAAGTVWFGGLGALAAVLRRRLARGDVDGAAEATARFSGWAAVPLAGVIVTGTTLGWINVGGLGPLTSTTYGRLLLAKVAVVGLVAATAGWNRFRLLPALGIASGGAVDTAGAAPIDGGIEPVTGDDEEGPPVPGTARDLGADPVTEARWQGLTRLLRVEILGLAAVLAITAVLANVTPGKAAVRGPVTARAALGRGTVEVVVDPARPGRNDIHAYLLDAQGRPDDTYDTASFSLSLPARDVGPLAREPVSAGGGHFQLVGTQLTLPGDWELTVTVKPDRFTEQTAVVRFRVR